MCSSDLEPHLLHAVTYRLKGHVSVDQSLYRSSDELTQAWANDPLVLAKSMLLERGHSSDELDQIEKQISKTMEEATQFAKDAAWPKPEYAFADVADSGAGQWY